MLYDKGMNALILGGQSPRHHEWVREVAGALRPHFGRVAFVDYRHWTSGGEIDVAYEMAVAAQQVASWDAYVVVAKSIGTVIATLGTAAGQLDPWRCVFCGFPLAVVQRAYPQVTSALAALPPTVCLQNEQDPLGSAAALQVYLTQAAAPKVRLLLTPGETHDYLNFEQLSQLAAAND